MRVKSLTSLILLVMAVVVAVVAAERPIDSRVINRSQGQHNAGADLSATFQNVVEAMRPSVVNVVAFKRMPGASQDRPEAVPGSEAVPESPGPSTSESPSEDVLRSLSQTHDGAVDVQNQGSGAWCATTVTS